MGHTSSPEMLVPDQTMTPGKNPKTFILQDNGGESLQSHMLHFIYNWSNIFTLHIPNLITHELLPFIKNTQNSALMHTSDHRLSRYFKERGAVASGLTGIIDGWWSESSFPIAAEYIRVFNSPHIQKI